MLNVRTLADMERAIGRNMHKIDRRVDVVVGIPRSGMLAATLIATRLQLPVIDMHQFAGNRAFGRGGKWVELSQPRVLLVDDSANKGRAMRQALAVVRGRNVHVTSLAVFGPYQVEIKVVDVWLEFCKGPRVFTWNMAKHKRLPRWGFDMDGVLCRDPTNAENDDGARYERFLNRTEQTFFPTRPIGHIVTGRLEKYRGPTEAWLRRHGIRYESLTMMPYESKAERMAIGGRGKWKAEQARRLGVEFFLESSERQASAIAAGAGIPVWCTDTQQLVGGEPNAKEERAAVFSPEPGAPEQGAPPAES